jgi:hypothetical protein
VFRKTKTCVNEKIRKWSLAERETHRKVLSDSGEDIIRKKKILNASMPMAVEMLLVLLASKRTKNKFSQIS